MSEPLLSIKDLKVEYRTSEEVVSAVNVKELQKEADLISKKLRETDSKIQETNWLTEF